MGRNKGSAPGYAVGIRSALEWGAEVVWLLDDDNGPEPGCGERLLSELERLGKESGRDKAIVCANRGDWIDVKRAFPPKSSFMRFHVKLLPYLLFKRLMEKRFKVTPLPPILDMPLCPYGGMMAYRAVFERFGFPREDFVLYGDDDEYTLRMSTQGVVIQQIRDARIKDLEPFWGTENNINLVYLAVLKVGADFRVYYGARNEAYIARVLHPGNLFMYECNKAIYIAFLFLLALLFGGFRRFFLILQAIRDGEAGRLGYNPKIPLP